MNPSILPTDSNASFVSPMEHLSFVCFMSETRVVMFHRWNASSFVSPVKQNEFYFSISLRGALPPPLDPPARWKMNVDCNQPTYFISVAVTTKPTVPQGFSLNGFPPASRAPPIYRTAQARQALDRRMVLQRFGSYAEWRTPSGFTTRITDNAKGNVMDIDFLNDEAVMKVVKEQLAMGKKMEITCLETGDKIEHDVLINFYKDKEVKNE